MNTSFTSGNDKNDKIDYAKAMYSHYISLHDISVNETPNELIIVDVDKSLLSMPHI